MGSCWLIREGASDMFAVVRRFCQWRLVVFAWPEVAHPLHYIGSVAVRLLSLISVFLFHAV